MLRSFLDGSVFGAERGEGPPWLLALHGWQRSNADFDQVLGARPDRPSDPFQGAEIASIALDLPGFGASPPPPTGWGTEAYAAAIAPLLDRFAQPVVILGHSFGGRVALRLAASYPAQVRALVLSGVPSLGEGRRPPRAPYGYRMIRRGAKLGVVSHARLEAARRRYGSPDYRAAEGVIRDVLVATLRDRYDELLPRIEVPVEMVWGEVDDQALLVDARSANDRLAHSELVVLSGVGHMVPTDAPDALRSALAKWRP